jgi:hypothetical protein
LFGPRKDDLSLFGPWGKDLLSSLSGDFEPHCIG